MKIDNGGRRIVYSSFLGGSGSDEAYAASLLPHGSLVVAGWTESPDFPTTPGAYQGALRGVRDSFVAVEPLLPDGAARYGYGTPWCGGLPTIDVDRMPKAGDALFTLSCRSAPPATTGLLLLGTQQNLPGTRILGAEIHVGLQAPILTSIVQTNAIGVAEQLLPLPIWALGGHFDSQFVFATPLPCPRPNQITTSNALDVIVQ